MAISRRGRYALGAAALATFALLALSDAVCLRAYLRYRVVVKRCPDGDMRQTANCFASGLRRGTKGKVTVGVIAHYATMHGTRTATVLSFEPSLLLVDSSGRETPLEAGPWKQLADDTQESPVSLPQLRDGDYFLRARVASRLGESSVDVPLALYAPARVHVITDRPLYEPGNTVKFRAVVLRAKDLAPIEGRPGSWFVTDPGGEVLLEEKAPAGEWGVVAGSFPLDAGAAVGDWKVRWASGDADDTVSFRVEPFTLPRFRVEASPDKPFYRPHDRPRIKGTVAYSSGAPVAKARLELTWTTHGQWPPPSSWMQRDLPKAATTDAAGGFSFDLPLVPGDLMGQVTLAARIGAVDPAGDRVEGSVAVLLSQDAIQVSAVTELADGLMEGFNNRVYLRATTAAGMVLPGVELTVKRAWDPSDPGTLAMTDEDGVAALQFDPGPAVNIVIPPIPVRAQPRVAAVRRDVTLDKVTGSEPSLDDQRGMDGWLAGLAPCARFVEDHGTPASFHLGVRVDTAGRIVASGYEGHRVEACLADRLKDRKLPPGEERFYDLRFDLSSADLPSLDPSLDGLPGAPEELDEALSAAALDARECLPVDAQDGALAQMMTITARAGNRELGVAWSRDPKAEGVALAAIPCIQKKLARLELREAMPTPGVWIARFNVGASRRQEEARPQATVMLGYELLVAASTKSEPIGSTKIRLSPGAVPNIRLRALPVLVEPGGALTVEVLRGPSFSGELPHKLFLNIADSGARIEAEVDRPNRKVTFTVPAGAKGFVDVEWSGARAVAFVRPKTSLSVAVEPEAKRYAPGQQARLLVNTAVAGKGTKAAVGLIGVDESLGQLAQLPGADELTRLRPKVSARQVFGAFDAQALALGRVQGENAAAATLLGIMALPTPGELDRVVHGQAEAIFEPLIDLTDHFYSALTELHVQTRAWEEDAPAEEKMHPRTMAKLWERALESCEKKGESVRDAFGRKLRLSLLPPVLLAQTDPRSVVVRGTRLPEDVENWADFVAREKP
jgi:hypothetical protein